MAASTSKKHENFVRESMLKDGNPKTVDELAGIGPKAKGELADKGLTHAHMLLVRPCSLYFAWHLNSMLWNLVRQLLG